MKSLRHYKIRVSGRVQGVGFRPFVYRICLYMQLKGWVNNSAQGVQIHLECEETEFNLFIQKLYAEKPGPALITDLQVTEVPIEGFTGFIIKPSDEGGEGNLIQVPSDLRTCPDCFADIHDVSNRRYRYPFTNCTNCGPRFSIIQNIPYDRPQTTMHEFQMCSICLSEYQNPIDRRFHAQPNACRDCGPTVELLSQTGNNLLSGDLALKEVGKLLREGNIIALKGLGGYQLLCDARQASVVLKLRQLKYRKTKPFAVMVRTQEEVHEISNPTDLENSLLKSSKAPIVLVQKKAVLPEEIAPQNPYLGIMLPTTGLHDLILAEAEGPLIVTSGNLSEEPICTEDEDAYQRLRHICDYFLTHNRKILRPLDDSVVRVIDGHPVVIRKARGYSPDYVPIQSRDSSLVCLGGQLKSSFTLVHRNRIIQSQYLGDLDNEVTFDVYKTEIEKYLNFYQIKPQTLVCDHHPQYQSSLFAEELGLNKITVQHHLAHIFSVMCEHQIKSSVIGISWDGSGYGETDQEMWGGEFFQIDPQLHSQRFGTILSLPLLGGERSYKEIDRIGIGLRFVLGEKPQNDREKDLYQVFQKSEYYQKSTSIGRLFEGISYLLGLCQINTYEGEAAQRLEFQALKSKTEETVKLPIINQNNLHVMDWRPLLQFLLQNKDRSTSDLARIVHNSLVEASMEMIGSRKESSIIVLAGGCFQNKILVESFKSKNKGSQIYFSQSSPPNDGGISLGQAFFASQIQSHPIK